VSSVHERDGKREVQEKFDLKKPDFHLEANRLPDQDLFDVNVHTKDSQGQTVSKKDQLPMTQLRTQIDQTLKD